MCADQKTAVSYDETLARLDACTNYERKSDYVAGPETLGLDRIRALLSELGDPQQRFHAVHLAGTKGKGSTAIMTARLLSALGLRVGLYTSPHLVSVRERIEIDGASVSRDHFCELYAEVRRAADRLEARSPEFAPPTYFEMLTAMAFVAFAESEVDTAVVETGLGGRFDATTALSPVVCGVTTVSLDHTRQLGDTVSAIAGEKGGIVKEGIPLVLGPQSPDAEAVLGDIASERNAPVRRFGRDYTIAVREPEDGPANPDRPQRLDIATWRGSCPDVRLPVLGAHQAANAAMAAALVDAWLERMERDPLGAGTLRSAWDDLVLPARVEIIGRAPWTVLDAAHNPASIWALSETLRDRFAYERFILVFGAAADKDVAGMLRILAPMADVVVATSSGHDRAMSPGDLAEAASDAGARDVRRMDAPMKALPEARELAGQDGLVCVTGSFYLAGEILSGMLFGLEK